MQLDWYPTFGGDLREQETLELYLYPPSAESFLLSDSDTMETASEFGDDQIDVDEPDESEADWSDNVSSVEALWDILEEGDQLMHSVDDAIKNTCLLLEENREEDEEGDEEEDEHN